jgi:hypothetical protein
MEPETSMTRTASVPDSDEVRAGRGESISVSEANDTAEDNSRMTMDQTMKGIRLEWRIQIPPDIRRRNERTKKKRNHWCSDTTETMNEKEMNHEMKTVTGLLYCRVR